MEAIFKIENVYVVVRNNNLREGVNLSESNNLIVLRDRNTVAKHLYGGRVVVECYRDGDCKLDIDGVTIQQLMTSESNGFCHLYLDLYHSLEQVAAFLNQIENLGVDSFLENYKLRLQELKNEVELKAEKLEQELAIEDNSDKSRVLTEFRKFIVTLTCIIFSLLVNMNAGLENHQYTEAYDQIINLYF
jgi:hypothetical protein